MGALLIWSRSDARRRLGTLIGIAILIALAGGATLASLAGARRSATAYHRLRVRTKALDAAVFGTPEQTKPEIEDPHVAAAAPFRIVAILAVDDPDLFPFVAPGSDAIGRTIERPLILEGRRADPARVDELVLPEAVARRVHKRVGDRMRFHSLTPQSAAAPEFWKRNADGPPFALRVVGISRSPSGLAVRDQDLQFTYLTQAWSGRYGGEIGELGSGFMIRLRDGPDAFGAWSRAVNPGGDWESHPARLFSAAPVEDSISVLVDGLRLFALTAAVAGLAAVVQAVERHAAGSAPELELLGALGSPRRERATASVLAVLPALLVGVLGALLFALAWSPFMPIGLARRAEPDQGWSFDALTLAGGALVVLVVVLTIAATVAWRAAARLPDRVSSVPSGRSARRTVGFPPVVATGVRLAMRRGRGRDVVPVRSAMTGVAAAIAGVIAVSAFASGLHRLVNEPVRYGVPWDATVFRGNNQFSAADGSRLAKVPEVDAIAIAHVQLDGLLDGQADGNGVAVESKRGRIAGVIRTGRAPRASDEIALGFDTARRLGAQRGDRIRLTGVAGSRSMRVVGEALLPTIDDPATLASGFVVAPETVKALKLAQNDAFERYVVTFEPGVSRAQGVRALKRAGFDVSTPVAPPEVARLRDVESLPRALAIILALIGSVVVVLALVVTVRRRRRDLALLQVFGFTRAQMRGSVMCQAGVFAALGLLVGIPLGLILGRFVWQHIAGALGIATDLAIPVVGMLLTALGVLIVAVVAALVPAARAARLHPAEILHQE